MVKKHERFALVDVSYAGITIGSATVDVWESNEGSAVWCARVLAVMSDLPEKGALTGLTRDGQMRSGECRVGTGVLGPTSRSKQIIELLGEGRLRTEPA